MLVFLIDNLKNEIYCFNTFIFLRLKREAWMYPEKEDDKDITSVLESCVMKLGYNHKLSGNSLVDLNNLALLLNELGLQPSKRQVRDKKQTRMT